MKITDDNRPLRMRDLCEATGYSHTYIRAMRLGFVNLAGEFRQLQFTHGPRCTAKAVWEFTAQNPDFTLRRALAHQKPPSSRKELSHVA